MGPILHSCLCGNTWIIANPLLQMARSPQEVQRIPRPEDSGWTVVKVGFLSPCIGDLEGQIGGTWVKSACHVKPPGSGKSYINQVHLKVKGVPNFEPQRTKVRGMPCKGALGMPSIKTLLHFQCHGASRAISNERTRVPAPISG